MTFLANPHVAETRSQAHRSVGRQPRACRLLLALGALLAFAPIPTGAIAGSQTARHIEPQSSPHDRHTANANEISPPAEILVVGATGSIGRLVVAEALRAGYRVRALVRDRTRAEGILPLQATLVVGDVTRPETLPAAVDGVAGIVFTHGANDRSEVGAREVDYGAVRNTLFALNGRPVRIVLMTALSVTRPIALDKRSAETRGWKRRGERLVRASGMPYTIVRPGWFDYNAPDQHQLVLLQGDTRQTASPKDGVIARRQVAEVLVASLSSAEANHKTFELVADKGPAQADLNALFGALETDAIGALDAVRDQPNLPLAEEPALFREDLERIKQPSP